MDAELAKQILDEILPYLEDLDTRNAAILQLLKDKQLTTEEQFAPYLAQAGKTSNVKWLAARLRIGHLLSSVARDSEKAAKAAPGNDASKNDASKDDGPTNDGSKNDGSKNDGSARGDPEKWNKEQELEAKLKVNDKPTDKRTPPEKKGTGQRQQADSVGKPAPNPNRESASPKAADSSEESNRDPETADASQQKAS